MIKKIIAVTNEKKLGLPFAGASILGIAYGIDPVWVTDHLSLALSHQVTQFGIAFGIAAWLHSKKVTAEIAVQLGGVVDSINNVATALRQDLHIQSERISNIENGFVKLTTRVDALETKESK